MGDAVSWYRPFGPNVERSLPFADRIHYRRIVLEVPWDPEALLPTILHLPTEAVIERQRHLAAAAPLLRYDFSGSGPDAFTALVDALVDRRNAMAAVSHFE